MPAALNSTSKSQLNSPASHENDGDSQISVANEESNEVPLKPKIGRKPDNKVEAIKSDNAPVQLKEE